VRRGEGAVVAGGRGARGRSRPQARTQSAVATLPRRRRAAGRPWLRRFAPSGRSLAAGLVLLAGATLAYGLARSTSAFAVTEVRVDGAPAEVAAEVRAALDHVHAESLLSLRLPSLEARVERLPWVASAAVDRAFPHTLAVTVVPEQPAAVLRQGAASWLVAASGRVLEPLERRERPALPRLWLGRGVALEVGRTVEGIPLQAVRAVAPLVEAPLPSRVASVRASRDELTLVLRSGFEIRLGDGTQRALKLEIARRILPSLPATGYLDVSVPKFPVAAETLNSQVEVETSASSSG
jgi:cell division protein FtsQ